MQADAYLAWLLRLPENWGGLSRGNYHLSSYTSALQSVPPFASLCKYESFELI
jgi:hypothetical protein